MDSGVISDSPIEENSSAPGDPTRWKVSGDAGFALGWLARFVEDGDDVSKHVVGIDALAQVCERAVRRFKFLQSFTDTAQ